MLSLVVVAMREYMRKSKAGVGPDGLAQAQRQNAWGDQAEVRNGWANVLLPVSPAASGLLASLIDNRAYRWIAYSETSKAGAMICMVNDVKRNAPAIASFLFLRSTRSFVSNWRSS
jgi:hypothetical protein